MDETLKAILAELQELKSGQASTNTRLDGLEAGQRAMQSDISTMKDDIETIKEDTAEIRTTVNAIGEWTEAAADVLKIKYPI